MAKLACSTLLLCIMVLSTSEPRFDANGRELTLASNVFALEWMSLELMDFECSLTVRKRSTVVSTTMPITRTSCYGVGPLLRKVNTAFDSLFG